MRQVSWLRAPAASDEPLDEPDEPVDVELDDVAPQPQRALRVARGSPTLAAIVSSNSWKLCCCLSEI